MKCRRKLYYPKIVACTVKIVKSSGPYNFWIPAKKISLMFETETDGLYLVQTLKWWAIDPPCPPPSYYVTGRTHVIQNMLKAWNLIKYKPRQINWPTLQNYHIFTCCHISLRFNFKKCIESTCRGTFWTQSGISIGTFWENSGRIEINVVFFSKNFRDVCMVW